MPYVDDETYETLMQFRELNDKNARQMYLVQDMYARINRQFEDIISRYGSLPNPLISHQVVDELRTMGRCRLEVVYGNPTKAQEKEMWKKFRDYFEVKRITQLNVSQIPDAMRFLQWWVPIEVIRP